MHIFCVYFLLLKTQKCGGVQYFGERIIGEFFYPVDRSAKTIREEKYENIDTTAILQFKILLGNKRVYELGHLSKGQQNDKARTKITRIY